MAGSSQANPPVTRFGDRPKFAGERLVVVALPMVSHRLARGYRNPFMQVVEEVDGVSEVRRVASGSQLSGHPSKANCPTA